MEATVFAAYETEINTGILEENVESFTISSGSITVDNQANEAQYPKLVITSDSSDITGVEIGGNSISLDKSLTNDDTLVLDFKEQEYTLNDTDIVEDITFNSSDRPILLADSIATIDITFTDSISVDVTHFQYRDIITNSYVQDFRISIDRSHNSDRKFKKKNVNNLILSSENFNISFSNMAYDWELYEAIKDDTPVRVTYHEEHTNGDKTFTKYLTGIKFGTYERFYRDSTGIIFESLVGEGTELI